ncbi:helix-turn-helix transcriptional regulator [Microvirga sp. 3-52]|nr:helix-turn-helix transcriptional regulator [Microvirga sp. 3-52]
MAGINIAQLDSVVRRLGEVVVDPSLWPDVLHQASVAVGATGAALLQSDNRTPDIPRSPGVNELFRRYFESNWHVRDIRAVRGVPMLRWDKVVFDQEFICAEEMGQDPFYNELLLPNGMKWFAGVGFRAGASLWAMSIQRSAKEGPFEEADKRIFRRLSDHLTKTATLSKAVEMANLNGVTNALDLVRQPAVTLGTAGAVISTNNAAEGVFDEWLRVTHQRLRIKDDQSRSAMEAALRSIDVQEDGCPHIPVVVRRGARRPVVVRILSVNGAASYPFLGARKLLLFTDLEVRSRPHQADLARIFGLTTAESRLAADIASGYSVDEVAERLGITRETARNQLKTVLSKTDTHRQGELVGLLSRMVRS